MSAFRLWAGLLDRPEDFQLLGRVSFRRMQNARTNLHSFKDKCADIQDQTKSRPGRKQWKRQHSAHQTLTHLRSEGVGLCAQRWVRHLFHRVGVGVGKTKKPMTSACFVVSFPCSRCTDPRWTWNCLCDVEKAQRSAGSGRPWET